VNVLVLATLPRAIRWVDTVPKIFYKHSVNPQNCILVRPRLHHICTANVPTSPLSEIARFHSLLPHLVKDLAALRPSRKHWCRCGRNRSRDVFVLLFLGSRIIVFCATSSTTARTSGSGIGIFTSDPHRNCSASFFFPALPKESPPCEEKNAIEERLRPPEMSGRQRQLDETRPAFGPVRENSFPTSRPAPRSCGRVSYAGLKSLSTRARSPERHPPVHTRGSM